MCKWRPFWALCPPFGHSGAHLGSPKGKKSVPKASERDFVDIVKTLIFLVFYSYLPPKRWFSLCFIDVLMKILKNTYVFHSNRLKMSDFSENPCRFLIFWWKSEKTIIITIKNDVFEWFCLFLLWFFHFLADSHLVAASQGTGGRQLD